MFPCAYRGLDPKTEGSPYINTNIYWPQVCHEITHLNKRGKKMAAELFPTKTPVTCASASTSVQQYQQQNLNNNNTIHSFNWQGLYPTIRERCVLCPSIVPCSY